jgi:hypothetical protein
MPESLKKISAAVLEDFKKALASQPCTTSRRERNGGLQNSFTSASKLLEPIPSFKATASFGKFFQF